MSAKPLARIHRQTLRHSGLQEELQTILSQQSIRSVYQPIVSLQDGTIAGYEALSRGPSGSSLAAPSELFRCAEEQGMLYGLEQLAREKAIQGAFLENDQLLFINISSHVIQDPQFVPGKTQEVLQRHSLSPRHVVFEITERSSIEDFSLAQKMLEHYRKQGYRIAIDDAGAGYSSLQAIAELQPDFVKIDRSLIERIHANKIKEYIVETFVAFAQKMDIRLIAEGIEREEELIRLTRMGVHYAQGYLLGAPAAEPAKVEERLRSAIVQHCRAQSAGGSWTIGDLGSPVKVFDRYALISEVAGYLKTHREAPGVVITHHQTPVGLVMREHLFQQLSGQYGFSLFWNRTIDQMMDSRPLIVDESMPVEHVSQLATSRSIRNLYDLVIVTKEGGMAGAVSIRTILETMTTARMEQARVANPLTGLPGNLQINREINKRLTERRAFSVIYADLDCFKWFNDRFGFQKGDQLIQFTADCLQQSAVACGTPYDFVGHVGGDDFIVISATPTPELLCREIIRRFEQGAPAFTEGELWEYAEDRSGKRLPGQGVTISLSLVFCGCQSPVTLEQISQAAARLKKKAKAHQGSVYCGDYVQ